MIISEKCRRYTNLSGMRINMLQRINKVLPFVADLTYTHIAVYVKAKDDSRFAVVSAIEPHTAFNPFRQILLGKLIPYIQEPLIKKCMDNKKICHGRRELDFGRFIDMYTFPVIDSNEVIAVICMEVNSDDAQKDGFSRLMKTARILLKNANKNTDAAYNMYKSISSRDGIIITDKDERIIFANMAASRIYHVLGINNLIGCHIFDRQLTMHITKETILNKSPYEKEIEAGNLIIIKRDIPVMEAGNLVTRIIILSDVTELRKKDRELLIKSAVIQEIHHRVKNNLQTIASLLRLQARRSRSPEVKEALRESINRILSISVVHEFLSQQGNENIDVVEVTSNILTLIKDTMLDENFSLTTQLPTNNIILPSKQASSLALIINELILNSIEHGFAGRSEGLIGLNITQNSRAYIIELYDNGCGLPEDFSAQSAKSLGLQIVRNLVEGDIGGSFTMYNDNGAHALITIPFKSLTEDE
ncbi:histidine kinase N-terminal domain-containing protein [Megamonas hypermegale]|uniref:histidine kinase N-terminal domain-containing protein n=1 Tax=Megamonas hypermegale TaxID=158847 RepID=UPI0025A3C41D|nr:histidine kinase N-terminal domain-containing protein [Megamonas hypermegale]MDM8143007.1 histidine kinase N-terminal domain-containing protein [Megamonas hypermegale]